MALGGGTFVTQNKVLPGAYINFVSATRATSSLSDRGIVAIPLELDWGIDEDVFQVTSDDFEKYSVKYFGYDYTHEKLKGLRDLFKNIRLGYFYKLNKGVKASCTIATAKYSGIRGNDLKIVVTTNIDDNTKFDVVTLLDNKKVDTQIAKVITDLEDNDYVIWKKDATLEASAGLVFTGGTNGEAVTGAEYQAFLDKIESYSFNALGCLATTTEIKSLFVEFTKRMRDKVGAKFQTVLYKKSDADYEGVVSVENKIKDTGLLESSLIYWTTGAIAGCDINKSNTNKKYDGEFDVDVNYTQIQLEEALKTGKFIFHKVGDEVHVLEDINTFVSFTDDKNDDFSSNQSVRVLDQIANDIATLFNTKYLGEVPNDKSGRISFWNDVVKHHEQLQNMRAIEDFKADDVSVEPGSDKKTVVVSDAVKVISAMSKLYMTVSVS
ncbi:phage tail sheath subtilisin-like domain-containing protein [Clostridioides difficile]|uniref:phage tail sheath family protein n=1 Tax=Clostridioides difficile TaxID=1496 RepID=UPI00097FDDFE|nr:phage tail sheath family protein [Clostridioides difficile]MDB9601610.1 phage tail sheath family protein [Clostridioides difficile]MDN9362602.1 phage tail sheath subtilisin-like domain-containing protein [Clostridioides difficile]MDN9410375.1 phage tail sheath subtilisin-like domain-containing protein [Clostridioides difficile]MDN9511044.1 phage tail sheath subtilisin-like domain-containing protein [Clostridioides difficile]MDN9522144.1 phage tail sheath subtilisin-like domain-containing pr